MNIRINFQKKTIFSVMAVVFWLVPLSAAQAAETPDPKEIDQKITEGASISDLVSYAYRSNPSIQAARETWKGLVERYRAVTAFPDPQLLVTYFPEPIETRLGPQDWNLNLSQSIPFPGKLSKAGELVEADIQMARLELDKTVRDLVVKVRESYHELLYIQEAKRILALNRGLLDHLRKLAETGLAKERTTLYDVVKGQSQLAQLKYDDLLLEELAQTETTQLNSLLNRPPEAELRLRDGHSPKTLAYRIDELYRMAIQYQEEIQMAETQINKARVREGLAKYEYLPEFRLGFFYAGIGNPDVPVQPKDAGRDAVGVQFGLSIPLWFGKNSGRVEEARADIQRAQMLKQGQVNDTRAQIRNLYFRLQNAERLIRLYRDNLIPQATQSLEVAETWFREKEGTFSDLVETQAVYYNFQLSLARARADFGKYLARLERLVGRRLTEKNEAGERTKGEGAR